MTGEYLIIVVNCGVGRGDVVDRVVGFCQDVDKSSGVGPEDDDELVAVVEEVGRFDSIRNGDVPLL